MMVPTSGLRSPGSPRAGGTEIQHPEIIRIGVGGVRVVPGGRFAFFPGFHHDLVAAYVYRSRIPDRVPAIGVRFGVPDDHEHGVPFRFRGLVLGSHPILFLARLHRLVQGPPPELRVREEVVPPLHVHLPADDDHRILRRNRGQNGVRRQIRRDDRRFDPRGGRPVCWRLDVGREAGGPPGVLGRRKIRRGQEENNGDPCHYRTACSVHTSSLHYRCGGTAVISTPVIVLVVDPVTGSPGTGFVPAGGAAV